MGLSLSVGVLAELGELDPEGAETFENYFATVNRVLARHHLPAHIEPLKVDSWGAQMFGYSGLHCLRRLAAHVDSGLALPAPGDSESAGDERLAEYYRIASEPKRSGLRGLLSKGPKFRREFDHLILHSDAEGFYLPQDFPEVLYGEPGEELPGSMLGSTPRLLAECERVVRQACRASLSNGAAIVFN